MTVSRADLAPGLGPVAHELRMVFTFLNGYIRNYKISSISPLGPQTLKYLLYGPLRKLVPTLAVDHP